MAKDRINSIIIGKDGFEWSVVSSASRGHGRVTQSGKEIFPEPPVSEDAPTEGVLTLTEKFSTLTPPFKGNATLGVPSAHVLARVVSLPHGPPEETAAMAELQADKFSPFPIDVLAVSHEIIQEGEEEDTVLICAVKESILEEARAALEPIGIRIKRVDAAILGWWHLLKSAGCIPDAGRHIFVLLTEPVVQLIGIDNGNPVAFRALTFSPSDPIDLLASELASEVNYSLMSLEMEKGPRAGHGITLCAHGDIQDEWHQALEAALEQTTHTEDLDKLGRAADGIAHRTSHAEPRLDMTPQAWQSEEESNRFKRHLLRSAAAVLFLWLTVVGGLAGTFTYQKKQLDALTIKRDLWNQQAMEVRELRRRVVTIQAYTNQTHSALECLREIAQLQTRGVELNSLTYRKGDSIHLSGSASAESFIYDFNDKLKSSGLFPTIELGPAKLNPKTRRREFDLTVDLPGGES